MAGVPAFAGTTKLRMVAKGEHDGLKDGGHNRTGSILITREIPSALRIFLPRISPKKPIYFPGDRTHLRHVKSVENLYPYIFPAGIAIPVGQLAHPLTFRLTGGPHAEL
jgi:hypothetical protein